MLSAAQVESLSEVLTAAVKQACYLSSDARGAYIREFLLAKAESREPPKADVGKEPPPISKLRMELAAMPRC